MFGSPLGLNPSPLLILRGGGLKSARIGWKPPPGGRRRETWFLGGLEAGLLFPNPFVNGKSDPILAMKASSSPCGLKSGMRLLIGALGLEGLGRDMAGEEPEGLLGGEKEPEGLLGGEKDGDVLENAGDVFGFLRGG